MKRVIEPLASLVLLCCLAGCGGDDVPQTDSESPAEPARSKSESSVKKVELESLPKLAEYLSAQDNGRLEVAPPKNWAIKGKGKDYLYAFVKDKNAPVPSIVVKVVDPVGGEEFNDVTPDNVVEFAGKVKESIDDTLESPRPLIIGGHAFARYVKGFKISGLPAEVQILTTIRGGRAYNVELRVRPQELKKYRDEAYAVAAGLKFSADAKPFEFKPAEETKPADAPPEATPPPAAPPPAAPPPGESK